MRKTALFCAVAAAAFGVFAEDLMFEFSSTGDTYADGKAVENGEVYALVWSADGAFGGINKDGTLVREGDEIVRTSFAENGGCYPTIFVIDSAKVKATGVYQVFLLDTRAFAADGTAGAPVGRAADGSFPTVNGYSAVTTATFRKQAQLAGNAVKAEGAGGSAMGFAADTPKPVITGVTPTAGGKVVLTVSNVVPYVPYAVTCGETPNALTQKDVASVLSLSDGVLTITVENPGANRFFKVTSK
jgi:hypothetical protein